MAVYDADAEAGEFRHEDGAELSLKPEIQEGGCKGCYFVNKPFDTCPKWEDGKLRCAYYTKGPCGIWVEDVT